MGWCSLGFINQKLQSRNIDSRADDPHLFLSFPTVSTERVGVAASLKRAGTQMDHYCCLKTVYQLIELVRRVRVERIIQRSCAGDAIASHGQILMKGVWI